MVLDLEGVKKYIPHRDPVLFVDSVKEFKANEYVIAEKKFNGDMEIFKGHFPGFPVLPGVVVVEALAQTAALLVNLSQEKTADESLFFFMSVESAKFRMPVNPDEQVTLKVELVRKRGVVFRFAGTAMVDGKVVANASFTAKWAQREA